MAAITTPEALAGLYATPRDTALMKVTDHVTSPCREWIAASPFVVLATSGPRGIDVTPRGDPAGFVEVADPRSLLLPDRPGNNRLDSLRNILADPRVGLLFIVPGQREMLRVAGRAEIRTDADLRARFAIGGRLPVTVLRIAVDQVFYHCSKAVARSGLWDPARQVAPGALPGVGAMLAAATAAPVDAAAQQAAYEARAVTLY